MKKKVWNFSKWRIFLNSLLCSGKSSFLQKSADFVTGFETFFFHLKAPQTRMQIDVQSSLLIPGTSNSRIIFWHHSLLIHVHKTPNFRFFFRFLLSRLIPGFPNSRFLLEPINRELGGTTVNNFFWLNLLTVFQQFYQHF